MYAATFDQPHLTAQHSPPSRGRLSALERHYPRICSELVQHWFRDDIDAYLAGLILDDRSDRRGFPFEVIDELMFLTDLRWAMTHDRPAVQPGPVDGDDFTYVQPAEPSPAADAARKSWWRLLGLR